jgi:hypothetical protein
MHVIMQIIKKTIKQAQSKTSLLGRALIVNAISTTQESYSVLFAYWGFLSYFVSDNITCMLINYSGFNRNPPVDAKQSSYC